MSLIVQRLIVVLNTAVALEECKALTGVVDQAPITLPDAAPQFPKKRAFSRKRGLPQKKKRKTEK